MTQPYSFSTVLIKLREHRRRKAQVVLGRLQSFMTHVDGKVGKGCCEISSFSHPPVQNTNSEGVPQIMETWPLASAPMGDPRQAQRLSVDGIDASGVVGRSFAVGEKPRAKS